MTAAQVLEIATWWLYTGGVVSAVFLLWGIDRVSEDARGAYIFRPMLIPGILLIWPLVLWRWLQIERGDGDRRRVHVPPRRFHALIWPVLGVIMVATLVGALILRQMGPLERAPVRLDTAADQSVEGAGQ
jgi:hypothetical protein